MTQKQKAETHSLAPTCEHTNRSVAMEQQLRNTKDELTSLGFNLEYDLTDRLNRGLQTAPMGKVLFIGADAPDITPALINQALKALDRSEAVFGPASDGGFWLFGLKKGVRTHSPFAGVRWSTEHALADVRAIAADAGWISGSRDGQRRRRG